MDNPNSNWHSGRRAQRSAREVMLCWNPGTAEVAIIDWPDYHDHSRALRCSTLACHTFVQKLSAAKLKLFVLAEAVKLIVRDRCDPGAVHAALLGVREYVDCLADDMPGVAAIRPKDDQL